MCDERDQYLKQHPGPWGLGKVGDTKCELLDGNGMHLGTFVGQFGDNSYFAIEMMCSMTALSGIFPQTAFESFTDMLERMLQCTYASVGVDPEETVEDRDPLVKMCEDELGAIMAAVFGNRPYADRDSRRRILRAVVERCNAIYAEYDASHPG